MLHFGIPAWWIVSSSLCWTDFRYTCELIRAIHFPHQGDHENHDAYDPTYICSNHTIPEVEHLKPRKKRGANPFPVENGKDCWTHICKCSLNRSVSRSRSDSSSQSFDQPIKVLLLVCFLHRLCSICWTKPFQKTYVPRHPRASRGF